MNLQETLAELFNLSEFEARARLLLDPVAFDFIAGGAGDEITLRRTRDVLDAIMLRPRVLVNVAEVDLGVDVLGTRLAMPIIAAPTGNHRRTHPDGELATARAVGALGSLLCVSMGTSIALEEIAAVASGPLWLQQYLYRDRAITGVMAERARASGCLAHVITVDRAGRAQRDRNLRNRYVSERAVMSEHPLVRDLPGAVTGGTLINPAADWAELDWFVASTALPVILKGILTAEDALLAVEHGARGIIVSNHGARQLDTAVTTIEALPEIAEAVAGRTEVYLDGGMRRGTDIVKALALGARAVLVGRPIQWGLTVAGEAGARRVLELLREELRSALMLCGQPAAARVSRAVATLTSPLGLRV